MKETKHQLLQALILINKDGREIKPIFTSDQVALYPIKTVAYNVGLTSRTIRELVKKGKVFGIKPAHDLFVSLEDVKVYRASPKNKGGRPKKFNA